MITRNTFLVLFFLGLESISCSPIPWLSERQDDPQCGNPAAVFVSSCWTTLGVSNYLENPQTGWNHTIPVCSDSTKCCLLNEAWTTCYLRLGRGVAGEDCTTMDDSQCKWNGEISSYLDPSIYAQVRYVMKSIYGVHAFFSSYFKGKPPCRLNLHFMGMLTPTFTALQYAVTQATLMITPLTQAIDPQQQTSLGITSILFALSLGLSFLVVSGSVLKLCIYIDYIFQSPSISVVMLGLSTAAKFSSQAFTISLQQAPGVARTMWPTGSDGSQTFQISKLDTQLSNATTSLSAILNRGLGLLMTDVPTFMSLEAFSDRQYKWCSVLINTSR